MTDGTTLPADQRYRLLPEAGQEIADAIGVEATLTLLKARGGTRISIPVTCDDSHWLAQMLGVQTAHALCEAFTTLSPDGRRRGAYIKLPLGPAANLGQARAAAYRAIDATLDQGGSVDEAVRASGMSRDTVMRRKKQRASNSPPPLLALMDGSQKARR